MSLSDDVQLNKAEKAWKPTVKKSVQGRAPEEEESDDPEHAKTQELFKRLRSILNKLTPQKFQELMKQVMDLTIDTEERLKGAIDLIFEKAISEPNSSQVYANMCRCLMGLKVPTSDKPEVTVNFRKLLLNRCQKEFEKDQDDDEIFEEKQKEIEAAKEGEELECLSVELSELSPAEQESRDQAHLRSLSNIKFLGELFKLKMLTEAIMHDCVVKLLKNHDEESLECLCRLLSTIGKDLDFEKAKPRMDQYFNQMDKIIKERKTSSRIRFMLQDVLDLRKSNWVPRRGDQGLKTIDQIHKKEGGGTGGRKGGNFWVRGSHTPGSGRFSHPQDVGWNMVPISKNRPIDTTRLSKITKPPGPHGSQQGQRKEPRTIISSMSLSDDMQLNKAEKAWKPKKKKSTRSHGAEEDEDDDLEQVKTQKLFSRLHSIVDQLSPQKFQALMKQVIDLTINTEERLKGVVEIIFEKAISEPNFSVACANMCRCLMGLKVPTSDKPEVSVNFRKLLLNRCQKEFEKDQNDDEIFEEKQKEIKAASEGVELQESRDQAHLRSLGNIKFIGELFKLKMLTEAIMHDCVVKLLKNHDEESLECLCTLLSTIGKDLDFEKAKPRMDQYFNEMDKIIKERKTSSSVRLMLQDVLDLRKNKWVPYREDQDPTMRGDQGPNTVDQIQKGTESPQVCVVESVNKFVTEQKVEFITGEEMESKEVDKKKVPTGEDMESKEVDKKKVLTGEEMESKEVDKKKVLTGEEMESKEVDKKKVLTGEEMESKEVDKKKVLTGEEMESKEVDKKKVLTGEELSNQLDRLIQDKANNQRIRDWVEANLDEQQTASNQFVRALMTSVCQSAIICDNPYKVDTRQITQRASLLQRYLSDEQKELQALYAVQALMVHMEQPANLLRTFFDMLYDEDVIKEEAFYKWETSKDPAEQTGKGLALKSVTAFFTWLREAEDESDQE